MTDQSDAGDEWDYAGSRVDRRFLGEAGEYLTAGKLLMNGFNIFKGAVDDGIDLVAFRGEKFYKFQVKTCQDVGEFDSGIFMASINLSTFSRHDPEITFCVFVIHYLSQSRSVDNEGQHTKYSEDFLVVPAKTLVDTVGATNGRSTVKIFSSYANDSHTTDYIYKMVASGNELILDDYLFDEFAQVEQ